LTTDVNKAISALMLKCLLKTVAEAFPAEKAALLT